MKYILIAILFFNLFINNDKEPKKKINSEIKSEINSEINMINIKIIDIDTKEELIGVKNKDKYTNFEGEIKINKGDSILLELISYEKINIKSIQKDTIIGMSKLY